MIKTKTLNCVVGRQTVGSKSLSPSQSFCTEPTTSKSKLASHTYHNTTPYIYHRTKQKLIMDHGTGTTMHQSMRSPWPIIAWFIDSWTNELPSLLLTISPTSPQLYLLFPLQSGTTDRNTLIWPRDLVWKQHSSLPANWLWWCKLCSKPSTVSSSQWVSDSQSRDQWLAAIIAWFWFWSSFVVRSDVMLLSFAAEKTPQVTLNKLSYIDEYDFLTSM
jgi:hypothetical protein